MSLTIQQGARLYHVPLVDYGREDAYGVLVASGCGIMMAVMDAAPSIRWCVDADSCRSARIGDFLCVASRSADPLVVCGWFSISDPTTLIEGIRACQVPPLVYAGDRRLGVGREVNSLAELLTALR